MAIEFQSRVVVPFAPASPDEVVRLADIAALSGGQAHYDADPPTAPITGMLWATPTARLFVFTGTSWLRLSPPTGLWDVGDLWDTGDDVWS